VGNESRAYDEAVRALSDQRASLAQLKGRSIQLVSLAAVTFALFTGVAPNDGKPDRWVIAALVVFAVIVVLCTAVVWPTKDWKWIPPAEDLVAEYVDHEDAVAEEVMVRDLALFLAENRAENAPRINRLYMASAAALALLGVEIVLLFLAIRS
jgi:hypothetical protein